MSRCKACHNAQNLGQFPLTPLMLKREHIFDLQDLFSRLLLQRLSEFGDKLDVLLDGYFGGGGVHSVVF